MNEWVINVIHVVRVLDIAKSSKSVNKLRPYYKSPYPVKLHGKRNVFVPDAPEVADMRTPERKALDRTFFRQQAEGFQCT